MNQPDIREQFLKAQVSVGITREKYHKRFMYKPNQSSENYLVERTTPSPSQLQGFTIQQEKYIGYLMSEMIFRAGESLKIPVSTTIVAVSIAHYFFSRKGHLDYDFRDVSMGALFLACKSQQTLRKSFEVSCVFDYIFKVFQGQRMPIRVQVLDSFEYDHMRKRVLTMENEILFELGFQIYKLFDIPHRYIGGLFKSLDRHPQCKKICQAAWTLLNDFYRTNCCLHYPGQAIAAASLYMALLQLDISQPTVPWWTLMESNLESIQELIGQLQTFYEATNHGKSCFQWVALQINEVGQKRKLLNVFPVNYYRKIMLEAQSQLRIKKEPVFQNIKLQPQIILIQKIENQKVEQKQHKERSRSQEGSIEPKKKKNKKEKKDKKKKKDKAKHKKKYQNGSQSKSRSRSRQKERNKSKRKNSSSSSKPPNQQPSNNDQVLIVQKNQQKEKIIAEEIQIEDSSKEGTNKMQLGRAKGLLSIINSQLKKHQNRKQKEPISQSQQKSKPPFQNQPKIENSLKIVEDKDERDSDQQLLAELVEIRKSKTKKQNQSLN